MTDVTAAALAASTAIGTAVAGTTLTAIWIGVDPVPLWWAAVGCGLASTVPREALGRIRATVMFLCSVPIAGLAGQWGAEQYMPHSHYAQNLLAAGAGLAIHYGLGSLLAQLEPLFRGWADKLGASRQ